MIRTLTQIAKEINNRHASLLPAMIAIGNDLIEVKVRILRGEISQSFTQWYAKNIRFSRSSATLYMRLARAETREKGSAAKLLEEKNERNVKYNKINKVKASALISEAASILRSAQSTKTVNATSFTHLQLAWKAANIDERQQFIDWAGLRFKPGNHNESN